MNEKGFRLQVLELAQPGNFMIAQDYMIDYYLARAKKVPEFIFIELGPEIYSDTGDLPPSYLNTGTSISDHTADQLWWRAQSFDEYGGTAMEKMPKYWNLGTHFLFNTFDFGLSSQLIAEKDIPSHPTFVPSETPQKPLSVDDVSPIRQAATPLSAGPLMSHVPFLVAFRRMQVKKLIARGARVVGFFQTVMTPLGIREYGAQMCRELHDVPCINADDASIRRQVYDRTFWFDPVHLLHPGAEKYSAWFADRLASSLASFR